MPRKAQIDMTRAWEDQGRATLHDPAGVHDQPANKEDDMSEDKYAPSDADAEDAGDEAGDKSADQLQDAGVDSTADGDVDTDGSDED